MNWSEKYESETGKDSCEYGGIPKREYVEWLEEQLNGKEKTDHGLKSEEEKSKQIWWNAHKVAADNMSQIENGICTQPGIAAMLAHFAIDEVNKEIGNRKDNIEFDNPEVVRKITQRIKKLSSANRTPEYELPADSFIEDCAKDVIKIIKHSDTL